MKKSVSSMAGKDRLRKIRDYCKRLFDQFTKHVIPAQAGMTVIKTF